jgi:hypothetical protein
MIAGIGTCLVLDIVEQQDHIATSDAPCFPASPLRANLAVEQLQREVAGFKPGQMLRGKSVDEPPDGIRRVGGTLGRGGLFDFQLSRIVTLRDLMLEIGGDVSSLGGRKRAVRADRVAMRRASPGQPILQNEYLAAADGYLQPEASNVIVPKKNIL